MDTDRDDLYDDIDFDPIHSATEEQLKILEFFESAELFEIRYLADFCNNLDVSVSVVVDYINVFRNNADYDYEAVISDLSKIGYECDNEFFRIDYTQYFNYRSGTSWAEILDKDFDTWSDSLMFFLSAWMLDNSFKAKNVTETTTYELSKEQKEVLNEIKKTSKKGEIINIESAENVNNEFKLEANYKPPSKPGTKAVTIKLKESTKFVRVYRESGKLTGGWVMEAEQIESLTPSQIKNKFALEYEPKYICDVEIPAGSTVRYGITNKIVNWGNGGGIQYDLMGQLIGEFTNERLL